MEKLESLAGIPKEEFLKSKVSQDIAKWNFYVVIQGCLDLGNHVISMKNFDLPESYKDILGILEEEKIISKDLAFSLKGMGGFRNLIAHGYFKIEPAKLYGYLKKLGKVKRYIKKLEPYL